VEGPAGVNASRISTEAEIAENEQHDHYDADDVEHVAHGSLLLGRA
jgi:hypothetical protein